MQTKWEKFAKDRLALTSIFGLCFMPVCQFKSKLLLFDIFFFAFAASLLFSDQDLQVPSATGMMMKTMVTFLLMVQLTSMSWRRICHQLHHPLFQIRIWLKLKFRKELKVHLIFFLQLLRFLKTIFGSLQAAFIFIFTVPILQVLI